MSYYYFVMANSDVEIFVSEKSQERIILWLTDIFGPLVKLSEDNEVNMTTYGQETSELHIVIQQHMDRDLTSIWFNDGAIPWDSHAACARQASAGLKTDAYCDPGDLSDYPGYFLRIQNGQEKLVDLDEYQP